MVGPPIALGLVGVLLFAFQAAQAGSPHKPYVPPKRESPEYLRNMKKLDENLPYNQPPTNHYPEPKSYYPPHPTEKPYEGLYSRRHYDSLKEDTDLIYKYELPSYNNRYQQIERTTSITARCTICPPCGCGCGVIICECSASPSSHSQYPPITPRNYSPVNNYPPSPPPPPPPSYSYVPPPPNSNYNPPPPNNNYNPPPPNTNYNPQSPNTSYNPPPPNTNYKPPYPNTNYNTNYKPPPNNNYLPPPYNSYSPPPPPPPPPHKDYTLPPTYNSPLHR